MNRYEAEQLAKQLLREFDLADVRFKWSSGKRQLGAAVWYRGEREGERELRLSRHLVDLNGFDEINDTIRHEIAHFKAGRAAGHGPVWKAWAVRCGANPNRTSHTATMPKHKYKIVCLCCNSTVGVRHKRKMNLDNRMHSRCGRESLGKLVWRHNH